jgi:hypothetical protein
MSALTCHGVHEAFEGVVDNLEKNDLLHRYVKDQNDESISIRKRDFKGRKSFRENRLSLKPERVKEKQKCCGGSKKRGSVRKKQNRPWA